VYASVFVVKHACVCVLFVTVVALVCDT